MNWVNGSGNGGVLLKETSATEIVLQIVFRFGKQCQQKLISIIRDCIVWGFRDPDLTSQPHLQPHLQPQVQRQVKQALKQESRKSVKPMGMLTEIRRYTGNEFERRENGDATNGLQQLLPALAGFCRDRWLVLISPPKRPGVTELMAAGIDPSRVLLVHARDNNRHDRDANGLSVVEQALRSGTCGAVVAWLQECDAPTVELLRQAAVTGHAWGVMFRENHFYDSHGEYNNVMADNVESPLKVKESSKRQNVAPVVDIRSSATRMGEYVTAAPVMVKDKMAQIELAIN
ncbi:hypothetical protein JYT26_02455 [Beggiatoa alba]|nr:hypothetical protein [Beggiatoa alba]